MTDLEIRRASPDEFDRFREAFALVFMFEPREEGAEAFKKWIEFDRSMVVEDGDRFVATGSAASYRMVVPGGDLIGAGGLTLISVQPTHRRRGLLRRMIRHHLEDVRDRGEPVSILWASESSIYGRFGYGMAAGLQDLEIETVRASLRDDLPPAPGRVRILENDDAVRAAIRQLQQGGSVGLGVPGSLEMREADWDNWFRDEEHRREGATRLRFGVYEEDGEPRGYVRYRQKGGWGDGGPEGKVKVEDIKALDGVAHAALWRFVLNIDLAVKVAAEAISLADPLPLLLADPRRLMSKRSDGLWVRIVDVPAALAARRYRISGQLVLDVRDPVFDEHSGRYLLDVGDDGTVTCDRTDSPSDVALGIEQLGAVYLGGTSVGALASIGLVTGTDDVIALADHMFSWGLAPANTVHF